MDRILFLVQPLLQLVVKVEAIQLVVLVVLEVEAQIMVEVVLTQHSKAVLVDKIVPAVQRPAAEAQQLPEPL
jgi:hypothetical protein